MFDPLSDLVPAGAGAAPSPVPAGPGLPMGGPAPMGPPMGGPPMGGPPMGGPPPMDMQPPQGSGPQFPTTNPAFIQSLLQSLLGAFQQDQAALSQGQEQAMEADPMMQALVAGAPMGPGAGADGHAEGALPGMLV